MIEKFVRPNTKCEDKVHLKITDSNNNAFYIIFAGNLDLYWSSEDGVSDFFVKKDDSELYLLINDLFHKIKSADKRNELINGNVFNWTSEDGEPEKVNHLQIIQNQEDYKISFIRNLMRFAPKNLTSICFCNSGSNYPQVVQEFMKSYLSQAYGYDFQDEMQ